MQSGRLWSLRMSMNRIMIRIAILLPLHTAGTSSLKQPANSKAIKSLTIARVLPWTRPLSQDWAQMEWVVVQQGERVLCTRATIFKSTNPMPPSRTEYESTKRRKIASEACSHWPRLKMMSSALTSSWWPLARSQSPSTKTCSDEHLLTPNLLQFTCIYQTNTVHPKLIQL